MIDRVHHSPDSGLSPTMTSYHEQITCRPDDIDLAFWRKPTGVSVPDDELSFLLVPDAVETLAVGEVAEQVHTFQADNAASGDALTHALMATMGGMLPGILIYDHLVQGNTGDTPPMAFGTIGVSLYKGPNERFDAPEVKQAISLDITDGNVLVIDDLGDRGGTLKFLSEHIASQGARRVMSLALYMKPLAMEVCPADFYFGEVEQDTWIITPRERVETLVKRLPVWKERGASEAECRRRLVDLIGYAPAVVDQYLPRVYARA
jgi:hypoxanthine phosphoribosyltransferase